MYLRYNDNILYQIIQGEYALQKYCTRPGRKPRNLKNGLRVNGQFSIQGDPSVGMVGGEYKIERQESRVYLELTPGAGWTPRESKFAVNLIYLVVQDFKHWPRTYRWKATMKISEINNVELYSKWQRISFDD